jgi:hypothetical protein
MNNMMNMINKIKLIFFKPFNFVLGTAVVIYFYKMFKKDLESENNSQKITPLEVFPYFKKYSDEIVVYSQEWSDKLFVIKYIFSIVFWFIVYQIIYLLIN